ncbi:hypothetical protein PoB_005935800 [Plakobranchus ocellatus]|uniref:Uncharacterized protein n=1 Tax=Plakobranchus ocellatus TaxID=259542 RepID=A0AAV4CLY6_9GAST|nr:hypothetical protein PoB_005935800 [Plakobranchus ocellatus]
MSNLPDIDSSPEPGLEEVRHDLRAIELLRAAETQVYSCSILGYPRSKSGQASVSGRVTVCPIHPQYLSPVTVALA